MKAQRTITLALAYYENAGMLTAQLAHLEALPAELRSAITLIVVDDASPVAPAALPDRDLGFAVRLYRMRRDLPWNQDACRNLAVAEAPDAWVLLTDMDHVPSLEALKAAICGKLDARCAYTFARVSAPDHTPYKPHPNSWLMTRELYDRAGGYDERYAGVYGTDGMFKKRVAAVAGCILELKPPLIRYPREVIADASTTTLERKGPANDARKAHVGEIIRRSGQPAPVRGLTEWDRVA